MKRILRISPTLKGILVLFGLALASPPQSVWANPLVGLARLGEALSAVGTGFRAGEVAGNLARFGSEAVQLQRLSIAPELLPLLAESGLPPAALGSNLSAMQLMEILSASNGIGAESRLYRQFDRPIARESLAEAVAETLSRHHQDGQLLFPNASEGMPSGSNQNEWGTRAERAVVLAKEQGPIRFANRIYMARCVEVIVLSSSECVELQRLLSAPDGTRVFIAFASEDLAPALDARRRMEALGKTVFTFLDESHSEPWMDPLLVGIGLSAADEVLVVDTPASLDSSGVRTERQLLDFLSGESSALDPM